MIIDTDTLAVSELARICEAIASAFERTSDLSISSISDAFATPGVDAAALDRAIAVEGIQVAAQMSGIIDACEQLLAAARQLRQIHSRGLDAESIADALANIRREGLR